MKSSTTPETSPSEEALMLLLSEVANLVASKKPLSTGLKLYEDVSLGDLGNAAKSIRHNLEQGKNLTESFNDIAGQYQTAIRSTLQVVIETRSCEPLYLLVDSIRQSTEERKQTRLAAIAPLFNAIIAAIILFSILPFIIQSTADAGLLPFDGVVRGVAQSLTKNPRIAGACGLIFVSGLTFVVVFLANRLNFKGRFYRDYAVFSRWIATQLQPTIALSDCAQDSPKQGQPDLPTIITLSAEVAGVSEQWSDVPEKLRQGYLSADELAIPTTCPDLLRQCLIDLASGTRHPDAVADDLKSLSEIYQSRSNYQGQWSRIWAPQIIGWALIIIVMIILFQVILYPVLEELKGTLT
jgi:hypothetical protein